MMARYFSKSSSERSPCKASNCCCQFLWTAPHPACCCCKAASVLAVRSIAKRKRPMPCKNCSKKICLKPMVHAMLWCKNTCCNCWMDMLCLSHTVENGTQVGNKMKQKKHRIRILNSFCCVAFSVSVLHGIPCAHFEFSSCWRGAQWICSGVEERGVGMF